MNSQAWIADSEPSERFPFYTRANVGEIAPTPMSPLSWKLVWEKGTVLGYASGHVRWGSFDPDELQGNNTQFACFGGYLYINWSMIRIQGERSPGMSAQLMDDAFFGGHPDIPPYEPHPDDVRPDLEARIQETIDTLMSADSLPDELEEDRAKAVALRDRRPDLDAATDQELVDHARSISPMIDEFFEPYMIFGTSSSFAVGILSELCADLEPAIPGRLLSGIGNVDSVPPSLAMWDLSRRVRDSPNLSVAFDEGVDGLLDRLADAEGGPAFLEALDVLRHEHGARGPGEWDMASRSWETRPALVLSLVDRLRLADDDLSPANRQARAAADSAAAAEEVRAHLADNEEGLASLDLALRLADLYVVGRERTKLTEMMTVHEVRVPIDELGKRMVERGVVDAPEHVCMLLDDELDEFVADPHAFAETIRSRQQRFVELGQRQEPFILYKEPPNPDEWPLRDESAEPVAVGDEIAGVPGGPGVAIGRARVITDPGDPRGLEPGDVLVAAITDPAWTPLFVSAGAVVVEIGAPMSHAMIVSRELGVPCVTGVLNASQRIKDGMLLEVNGGTGTVTILEEV